MDLVTTGDDHLIKVPCNALVAKLLMLGDTPIIAVHCTLLSGHSGAHRHENGEFTVTEANEQGGFGLDYGEKLIDGIVRYIEQQRATPPPDWQTAVREALSIAIGEATEDTFKALLEGPHALPPDLWVLPWGQVHEMEDYFQEVDQAPETETP